MQIRRSMLLSLTLASILSVSAGAQLAPPPAASLPTQVPALIAYSGLAIDAKGQPLTGETAATFLIYKDQQGGEPLFAETQTIAFDQAGHYKVQLGASNPNGLPSDLFASGEARWLEVQIAGEPAQARMLLASVPYALKAADAATLGGLPASAFALADRNVAVANATSAAITPNAATAVTTIGGTANKLAKFSGASTIVNSILYDNGTDVGIGTTTPIATLDVDGSLNVDGATNLNGQVTLPAIGTATASADYDSQSLKINTSVYNSSTMAAVAPRFVLQAEPTGNNTASPNATLNLLASATATYPGETGLYINTNGTIHFASGQTFGATSPSGVAFNGTSNSGAGVQGTSDSGAGVVGNSASQGGYLAGVTGIDSDVAGAGVFGSGLTLSNTALSLRNSSYQPEGAGVWGDAAGSHLNYPKVGVQGTADDQVAGDFQNNSPQGVAALVGVNYSSAAGSFGAIFGGEFDYCYVNIEADFYCYGSNSTVVPVDSNSRKVALYAVESPENWFEDFGSAQLSNGVATVALEPTFAQTVNLGVDYHVFLTPNGDSKGLYVSQKTAASFEVRESGGGRSTLAFDYRIVARRKGYETTRLADKTKEWNRASAMTAAHAKQTKE